MLLKNALSFFGQWVVQRSDIVYCPHSLQDLETFRQLCAIQRTFFFPSGKLFPIVYEQLNSKCLTNHRFVRWKIFSSLHATNPNKIYKIDSCRKQEEYKIKEICHTFYIAIHHWKMVFCYQNRSQLLWEKFGLV